MKKGLVNNQKLENILSQKIQDIYQHQLKQQLQNISFRIFDRTLIIIMEGTVTAPEKLLSQSDRLILAKQVRQAIDLTIQPQIKNTIEEVMDVTIVDFLCDTTIDNNCTAAIAIFELTPKQT